LGKLNGGVGSEGDNTTNFITVKSDGKIGVGTETPEVELDIIGDAKANDFYSDNFWFQGGEMIIGRKVISSRNPLNIITLKQDGKVGINNINPSYSLDVQGDANFKGVYANSITFTGASAHNITFEGSSMNIYKEIGGKAAQTDPGGGIINTTLKPIMIINEGGKIAIGNKQPKETLDIQGNMIVDTVKINKSIYLPNDLLSFSYYRPCTTCPHSDEYEIVGPGTDKGDSIFLGDNPEKGNGAITEMMTLKYIKDVGVRVGIGIANPETTLHVNGIVRAKKFDGIQSGSMDFLKLKGEKLDENKNFTKYIQFKNKGVINSFNDNNIYFMRHCEHIGG
jgi:hypothetical protein